MPKSCDQRVTLVTLYNAAIVWSRDDGRHMIRYGLQTEFFVGPNASLDAAREFGECVHHYLECCGLLDSIS